MRLPEYLEEYRFLPEPIVTQEEKAGMTYDDFSVLADSRVRQVTPEQYQLWKCLRSIPINIGKIMNACSYDFRARLVKTPSAKLTLSALDIIIQKDLYEEYPELREFLIAHEKWEIWQRLRYGVREEVAHVLSRHHEYALAVKQGKAEDLLEFYQTQMRKLSVDDPENEHEVAYEFARLHVATSGQAE